jgi:hypothetical protein
LRHTVRHSLHHPASPRSGSAQDFELHRKGHVRDVVNMAYFVNTNDAGLARFSTDFLPRLSGVLC